MILTIKQKFAQLLTWLTLMVLTLILVLSSRLPAQAETPRHYTELQFPPLPEIQLPQYERYQLKNGMTVYLMEDHELPLISGQMFVHTGSRLEDGDKVGLATITGELMRTGGTKTHGANELNQILEQRAGSVESGIDNTSGNIAFSALSEDTDLVFRLFAEVIKEPAFDPTQFDLIKLQLKGSIARRNDDSSNIADREFNKLIYGDNSPYARTVEYATLKQIQSEDVISFYQKYYHPQQMLLGIVGDFNPQQMKALIAEVFDDWQVTNDAKTNVPIPIPTQAQTKGVFFVDQPQLNQSTVVLGHLGGELKDQDFAQLSVLNGVLNGFGSRLFNELRSRQGLAYSVYGFWSANYDYPGVFMAGGQTRSAKTVPLIKGIFQEIEKLQNEPITEKELKDAKDSILNSFVFKFQETSQTLARLLRYEYFGYPKDFIFTYQDGVKSTTIEDIQRVAKTYLKPEQIVTLVVGNQTEIDPPLTDLDENFKTIDITIKPDI
jgi:zinc protease